VSRRPPPHPFLKWAGGKYKQIPAIAAQMPERFEVYAEPFVGGGAVFIELAKQRRFERAVLCDRNAELINVWVHVRDHVEALLEASHQWQSGVEEVFYAVRALEPADDLECAARTLWLNKNCFNGLYRRNRSGKFNVPWGRYKNPRISNPDNLRKVSELLQGVELRVADFEPILANAESGWVIYCDPPYWPVSRTAHFTAYDGFAFREDDQARLAGAFAALPSRGARGVLSNSSVPETRALYEARGLDIQTVTARRSINRDGGKRGPVEELLVTTR